MSNEVSAVVRMADPIGFDIGMDGSDSQAALLNGFARAFVRSMPNRLDREKQMAYMLEHRTSEARGVFVNLGEMCGY